MRIFLAGATGALGRRLVPLLVGHGHQVTAMTRSPEKAAGLRVAGADPLVADALDRGAVLEAVAAARPEVVVHQLTDLAGATNLRRFDEGFAATNRLRTQGTDHLVEAARAAGARRLVAQSFAGWPFARVGGPVKTEDDPLDPDPPAQLRRTLDAIRHLESAVLGAADLEGVVLRYGGFYGPGTSAGVGGYLLDDLRRRRLPVVGAGGGVWSFVHIDDAATATVAAVERGAPGIYQIVDDDPAPVSAWLPALAAAAGARPPRRVPVWLARLLAGEHGVVLMTEARGASNAKARRELGWAPAYPSWRQGFRRGLGLPSQDHALAP
jgi:nucleoside-diphosphate-sugar epimerase